MSFRSSITFQRNGHTVSEDDFLRGVQDDFEKLAIENVINSVVERLEDLRCEAHDKGSEIVVVEQSGNNASILVRDVCCDEFKAKVDEALRTPQESHDA